MSNHPDYMDGDFDHEFDREVMIEVMEEYPDMVFDGSEIDEPSYQY